MFRVYGIGGSDIQGIVVCGFGDVGFRGLGFRG